MHRPRICLRSSVKTLLLLSEQRMGQLDKYPSLILPHKVGWINLWRHNNWHADYCTWWPTLGNITLHVQTKLVFLMHPPHFTFWQQLGALGLEPVWLAMPAQFYLLIFFWTISRPHLAGICQISLLYWHWQHCFCTALIYIFHSNLHLLFVSISHKLQQGN